MRIESSAACLTFRHQAFIDGKFVDAASGDAFGTINPATDAVLTNVAACDLEDVNRAVAAGAKHSKQVFGRGPTPDTARVFC